MKYTSIFPDINEVRYKVEIQTASGSLEETVKLGETPFKVKWKGDTGNLYKPVRYSGATVQLLAGNPYFDVYASGAKDTKVKLRNLTTGKTEWTGYGTPCVYQQNWDEALEELEIECIDGLSVLKYFKYQAPVKRVLSFKDIIVKLLARSECYTGFSFPTCIRRRPGSERLIENALVSEALFFEAKDNEEKLTDDDVAWTCDQVLEEICRYLGVTAAADGEIVRFIDYDGIRNGTEWDLYDSSGQYLRTEAGPGEYTVQGSDYRDKASSISLEDVYNKITVKDSPSKFDEAFPDPFDFLQNITADSDPDLDRPSVKEGGVGSVLSNGNPLYSGNTNLEVLIDRAYSPDEGKYAEKNNFIGVQYAVSPYVTLYSYDESWNQKTYPSELNYTGTQNFRGAVMAKMDVTEMELYQASSWSDFVSFWDRIHASDEFSWELDKMMAQEGKTKISGDDILIFLDPDASSSLTEAQLAAKPFVKFVSSDTAGLFGGQNSGLLIQGQYAFHCFPEDPYPIPDGQVNLIRGKRKLTAEDCWLLARLKWGSQYWDGDKWTSTPSNFKIKWLNSKDIKKAEDRRGDHRMFKWTDLENTVYWRSGIGESGTYVPVPDDGVVSGSPELILYRPKSPEYESNQFQHKCVFLKGFTVKAVVGDPSFSDVNKSDTAYTNVIDAGYASEFKDLTFKITTDDGKNPSYSSVGWSENGTTTYLDKTVNDALDESGWTSASPSADSGMRFEEHLIYRLSNQYSTPTCVFKCTLRSGVFDLRRLYRSSSLGKAFVLNECELDYRYAEAKLNLIEKK